MRFRKTTKFTSINISGVQMIKKLLLILFLLIFSSTFIISQNNEDQKKEKNPYKSGTFSGLKFRLLGPAVTSGRVTDFAVNPKNIHEFYVAVACGNVWKTTNSGTTWDPIFDDQDGLIQDLARDHHADADMPANAEVVKLLGAARLKLRQPDRAVAVLASVVTPETQDAQLLALLGTAAAVWLDE